MRPVRTVALAAVGSGVLLAGAGLLGQAFASGAHDASASTNNAIARTDSHRVTIRFAAKELTRNVPIDVGPAGNSVGDSVIEHETLVRNGHRIGHDTLQCTAIHGPPHFDFQCVGTLVFANGEVTVQGATDFSEIEMAVTGGTGAYQGAYGQLLVHGTATTTDRDTLNLVVPGH